MLAFTNFAVSSLNQHTCSVASTRVMCTDNLYKNGKLLVANGTMGEQTEEDAGTVLYDNGFVDTRNKRAKFASTFVPARCMTVHKSQGNEFSVTGVVVVTSYKGMPLQLIYTALSRFKHRVVVFGSGDVLRNAFTGKFSDVHVDEELVSMFNLSHK